MTAHADPLDGDTEDPAETIRQLRAEVEQVERLLAGTQRRVGYLAGTLETIAGMIGVEWTGRLDRMSPDCQRVIAGVRAERASRQDWAVAADLATSLLDDRGRFAVDPLAFASRPDRSLPEISLDDLLAAEAAKLAGEGR